MPPPPRLPPPPPRASPAPPSAAVTSLGPPPARKRGRRNRAPQSGGGASGATEPGGNALMLNGTVSDRGLVGVSFRGSLDVDTVISQGCRPIGQNFVVTRARNNPIPEPGGRPAPDLVADTPPQPPHPPPDPPRDSTVLLPTLAAVTVRNFIRCNAGGARWARRNLALPR